MSRIRQLALALGLSALGCDAGFDGVDVEPEPRTDCAEATSLRASPQSIDEAVAFINQLPHPVTLDCFLERLERPLPLAATSSVVSLQPAFGDDNPRLFLFYGELIMSVAIDGDPGRTLLEFGEIETATQTVKGEIAFPVSEALTVDDAFERIEDGAQGTKCRLCHRGERPSERYARGRVSDGLAFIFQEHVPFEHVVDQYVDCRLEHEPSKRCDRYRALFDHGPVYEGEFPEDFLTFLDYD